MSGTLGSAAKVRAQTVTTSFEGLAASFGQPPMAARPRMWWHWIDGNVTQDGIRKDLDWMSRMGVGGVQNFVANSPIAPVVASRPSFMSAAWRTNLRFAVSQAAEAGFEYAVPTSVGWSATGGRDVPAVDGMKKLAFSEALVDGGGPVDVTLPALPTVSGAFQFMPLSGGPSDLDGGGKIPVAGDQTIIVAVPEVDGAVVTPRLVAGAALIAGDAINDPGFLKGVQVPVGEIGQPTFIDATFDRSVDLQSLTIFMPGAALPGIGELVRARLEVADQAGGWRPVIDIPTFGVPTTTSFARTTGQRFRVALEKAPGPETLGYGSGDPGALPSPYNAVARRPTRVRLAQLTFSTQPKVHAFETKAGFGTALDYYALSPSDTVEPISPEPSQVIDVTSFVEGDRLSWPAPPGRWRVIRIGWSLTGATNHPGGDAAGLEVDKYDAAAVRRYIEAYLGQYREAVGADLFGARGLNALLHDSVEIGPSNWTPSILSQFERLRGYDPRPWLPTLTGTIIGSRRRSDAFLYDFRRTLADLIASEHYGQIAAIARVQGLTVYGEALERARPALGDDMAMRSHADVPSGAMWVYDRDDGPQSAFIADVRGAASVAHVLGRPLVGTESLTTFNEPWTHGPGDLKPVMDLAFLCGTNRPMMHASVHQPVDDKLPGLSLGIFGQYLTRHETWAEMSRPFFDYISRSCHLLQYGRHVADIAYFYGEEAPLTALYLDGLPDIPAGYDYDFINADLLIGHLRNDGRDVVSSGGARYQVIALGGSSRFMTLPVLSKLADLVEGGATLIGSPPLSSPSLADDEAAVAAAIRRLWSSDGDRRIGRGRVIATDDLHTGLRIAGLAPDVQFSDEQAPLMFIHRTSDDADIYFISNRQSREIALNASFRVGGKGAELWHPESGVREPASYRPDGDRTIVTLRLQPDEAVFVVLSPSRRRSQTVDARPLIPLVEIQSPWRVSFQSDRGAPAALELPTLMPLNERAEPGIRYFSGTATYTTRFERPESAPDDAAVFLDLGEVAEVFVNGMSAGITWKSPYRVDIGAALRPGENELQVAVATLWRNRLIGDAQPSMRRKITHTSAPTYRPDAALVASGLIGPVRLMTEPSA